jgi:hypothetical protein
MDEFPEGKNLPPRLFLAIKKSGKLAASSSNMASDPPPL